MGSFGAGAVAGGASGFVMNLFTGILAILAITQIITVSTLSYSNMSLKCSKLKHPLKCLRYPKLANNPTFALQMGKTLLSSSLFDKFFDEGRSLSPAMIEFALTNIQSFAEKYQ